MGKIETMKAGFGRKEITPRVGVELCGFGPFRCRHSISIRDRLWARAMAIEQDGVTVVIVSCDLIGITLDITQKVRARLRESAGLPEAAVMICRESWDVEQLRGLLSESEARLNHPDATDAAVLDETWNIRMETVYVLALRDLVRRAERGETLEPATEVHGIRIGPITLLGSPFETFQAIKNDVRAAAQAPLPLVMSFVDDSVGYAPDRTAAARGGYAQDKVPLICGEIPYANAHAELVAALLRLDDRLA